LGCIATVCAADIDQAVKARDGFKPMTLEECEDLESRTAKLLQSGRISEPYKSTDVHDSTDKHPEWLV
jgi:hypothetical protein